ncbi:polyprotein [Phytophthora megakarya]|uniref:Polyprotein n=1 Tax=Phytophthora megakarya TaxID=4795 RepID=A0A225VU33_9STRA|nr:polyprotein [Phytophthora megakarya]
MNDASTTSRISLEHASYPHLSVVAWEALHHLAAASGDSVIKALLMSDAEEQQRLAAQAFMVHELANLHQRVSTPTKTKNKSDIVKLDVSTYSGEGEARLHLNRWFCEVDIAVAARQISTELARKAKEWVLGKLVADASCFPTVESMKPDLRLAFETPQDKNIQRSSFLSLKLVRMSMLEYIQRARHLISCITSHPMV